MPGGYLWGWDGADWVKVQVSDEGYVLVDMSEINLNDLNDVNVTAPTDGYVLYWDETAGEFKLKAVAGAKIQDADGDTSWDTEEAADADTIVGKVANVEAFRIHTEGILDLVKQSSCMAYRSVHQPGCPSGIYFKIALDVEDHDTQNEFDSTKKTGTADATEALKLHDADGGFEAADVGAVILNTTDDTYAIVTAFEDIDELTLNTDIMANGEAYELYRAKFTATKAGRYIVMGRVLIIEMLDTERTTIAIYKNGAKIVTETRYLALNAYGEASTQGSIALDALDYVELWGYHSHASTRSLYGSVLADTSMAITKVA